jgi:hypothetical protein
MSQTTIIVGIPLKSLDSKNEPVNRTLHDVGCPMCLDTMLLTINQLKEIFTHVYLDDKFNEFEIMCNECMNQNLDNYLDDKYKNKIKLLAAY